MHTGILYFVFRFVFCILYFVFCFWKSGLSGTHIEHKQSVGMSPASIRFLFFFVLILRFL